MYNEDHKIAFNFSPELDVAFLLELYGEDLQQAELVFESTVQQLRAELQLAENRFHDGDTAGLKKVIHKMKPLFGYIGLNETMQEFASFEAVCAQAATMAEAEGGFHHIRSISLEAIKITENEIKRLKQYNSQYL
ncbi:hypothetical protein [Agriterribacter sp.]|uniref:hypothetical protein n=1 Tax=Agriterribacter sp. TaxID=2821509 RepID=UPI002C5C5A27|nr:hypothetical protein [Agriterribacter sp.]HRP57509.1 hypothetical protein [Agriterribacter sp.]